MTESERPARQSATEGAKRGTVRNVLAELEVAGVAARATADRLATAATGHGTARREVLATLAEGPATVPSIARRMRQSRQSVQRLVDALEREELLQRMRNPEHHTSPVFTPTPAGLRALARIEDGIEPWRTFVAARLTEKEAKRLARLTARIAELADEYDPARAARSAPRTWAE